MPPLGLTGPLGREPLTVRLGLVIESGSDESDVVRGGGAVGEPLPEPLPSSRDRVRDFDERWSGAVVDVADAGEGEGERSRFSCWGSKVVRRGDGGRAVDLPSEDEEVFGSTPSEAACAGKVDGLMLLRRSAFDVCGTPSPSPSPTPEPIDTLEACPFPVAADSCRSLLLSSTLPRLGGRPEGLAGGSGSVFVLGVTDRLGDVELG